MNCSIARWLTILLLPFRCLLRHAVMWHDGECTSVVSNFQTFIIFMCVVFLPVMCLVGAWILYISDVYQHFTWYLKRWHKKLWYVKRNKIIVHFDMSMVMGLTCQYFKTIKIEPLLTKILMKTIYTKPTRISNCDDCNNQLKKGSYCTSCVMGFVIRYCVFIFLLILIRKSK